MITDTIKGKDKNQFSQIAMIAQGDFLKLLVSSTEDRKKIFQKLFHTENYQELQNKLKEENSRLESLLSEAKRSINQDIDRISSDENDPLKEKIDLGKSGNFPVREIADVLVQLIEEDKIRADNVQNALGGCEGELLKANNELQAAKIQIENEKKTKSNSQFRSWAKSRQR